jgi:hypothetical protein
MKKILLSLFIIHVLITEGNQAFAQNDTLVWKEFVIAVKEGQITREKIRPYHELLTDAILQFLTQFREEAVWEEWETPAEIHRVNEKVHFLIPLCWGSENCSNFCFSLITEQDNWYFHHMENINIRLDTISHFPATEFTKLPDSSLHWIRAEFYWTHIIRLYNFLKEEKGVDFALNWLCDGKGYMLAAETWIPFKTPEKAFILYACFDQSVVKGHKVTLQNLDDEEAVMLWKPNYLRLYTVTGQIRKLINFDEYRTIFEKLWQDRAKAGGWTLNIEYLNKEDVRFQFIRNSDI